MARSKNDVNLPRWCKECEHCACVHMHHKKKKTCTIQGIHIPFWGIASLCNSDSKRRKK